MGSKIWTRNYDNLFSAVFGTFGNQNSAETTTAPTYDKPWVRDCVGTWRTLHYNKGVNFVHSTLLSLDASNWMYGVPNVGASTSSYPYIYLQIGGGEGVANTDDYQLFLPYTTDLRIGTVTESWSYDSATHTYTKQFKIPVAYNGSAPITVTEFGLFGLLYCGLQNNNNRITAPTLLYHEFLDVPVTLEQNDTLEITINQSIVQPNYNPYPTSE